VKQGGNVETLRVESKGNLNAALQEVLQERNRLEAVMEALPVGVAILDARGGTLEANEAFEELWGELRPAAHTIEDYAKYKAWWVETGQPLKPEDWASAQAILRGKTVKNQLLEIERFDGARAVVLNSASPIFNAEGNITGCAVAIQDITALHRANQAVRQSEERLQQSLLIGRSFTFDWNPATDAVLRSQSCEPILGLSGGDIIHDTGQRYFQRVHPEDRERFVGILKGLKPGGESYETEYRVIRGDGSIAVLEEIGKGEFDGEGRLIRLFGTATDITDHKRMEEALIQSEQRYRLISEYSDDVIWTMDLETQRFTYVSPSIQKLRGYTPEEAMTQRLEDVLTPESWREVSVNLSQRIAAFVAGDESMRTVARQFEQPRKDGTAVTVEAVTTILTDAGGKPVALLGVSRDITERRRAEAALREIREDLDHAQAVGGIGSWRLDVRKNVLTWSAENHRIFGIPEGTSLTYETFLSTIHPDDREYVDTKWKAALTGKPYDIEHRIMADGRIRWVREKAYLEFDARGELLGGFGITQDITERKDIENQMESLARFPGENPNPVLRISAEGVILYCNKSGAGILEEWKRSVGETVPAGWRQRIADVLQKGEEHSEDLLCGARLFNCVLAPVAEGRYVNLYGRDITQQKKAQQALLKAHRELQEKVAERTEELTHTVEILQKEIQRRTRAERKLSERSRILEAFFAHTLTPLVILDPNFNFIRVNEAYAKACQKDISEFEGHNHFEFYPDAENRRIFETAVRTKTPYQAVAKPFTFPDHPEWGVTYWDWVLFPLLDERGEVEYLVFSLKDVTESQLAQEKIQSERHRLHTVLETLPAYVCLITPDHHMPFANRVFRELFGESGGKRCYEFLFDRTAPCEVCETFKALETQEPHQWEWTGPNGHFYDVFDFPFTDTDGSRLILEMGIDITEQKQSELRSGITNTLLELFARKSSRKEYLDSVVNEIGAWSGCRCAGIRLADANGCLPYVSRVGFSEAFLESEGTLRLHSDSCLCIRAVTGLPDCPDRKLVTARGSFYSGDTFSFLESLTEAEQARYRGACMKHGFASLAVIPVRYRDTILGAIHLADEAKGKVTRETVEFLESMASLIGEAIHRFDMEEQLRHSHEKLRSLALEIELAGENERRQIAVDLHDSIGQILCFSANELKALSQGDGAANDLLPSITRQLESAIEQVRSLSFDLSPSLLYDLGLSAAVEELAEKFSRERNIPCRVSSCPEPIPLTNAVKILLYRSVRELLINIAKHAQASEAIITLRQNDRLLLIEVEDDGRGFQIPQHVLFARETKGFGLFSVRERILRIGGSLDIQPRPQGGTRILLTAPLHEHTPAPGESHEH